nr:ribonuclease H-like domain-containing protein [Tanacetum cinerariifolium]
MRKSILKQEFSKFKICETEGLHKGYDKMQKILSQLNRLKAKPEDEDINLKFLRALPSSWAHVALTLKTKSGLELLSFDDLYYKLKTLEVVVKDTLLFPQAYLQDQAILHLSGNVIEDILQSFVADTELEQQLAYEDFKQIEKLDLEEMDLKWKMAMLSVRVHKFKPKVKGRLTLIRRNLLKADEGFFVGYSLNSKSFRVFNSRTRIVKENLHIRFSESTPNVVGSGPDWLFDIDALIRTMNYEPIIPCTQSNGFAETKASDNPYHPFDQVIGDLQSATQTRKMSKNLEEHRYVVPTGRVVVPTG